MVRVNADMLAILTHFILKLISLSIINYLDNLKKILWNPQKIIMYNHLYIIKKKWPPKNLFKNCQIIDYSKRKKYIYIKFGVSDEVYELNYFKAKIFAILKRHRCRSNGN